LKSLPNSAPCTVHVAAEQVSRRGRKTGAIIAPGKQATIDVHRHVDGRVSQPILDDLGWQFQAAVRLAIDTP
jgi:hypothetical protein